MIEPPTPMARAAPCPECEGVGEVGAEGSITRVTCSECGGTGKVPSAEEYAIHDTSSLKRK